jgi:hypothetical protein
MWVKIMTLKNPSENLHSYFFSPELRCFAPVSAHPNFVACFGGEFANVEVQWLISAFSG